MSLDPRDPANWIGEVLGIPAAEMREPATAEYRCPYITSPCIKRGHQTDDPYPVCSLYKWEGRGNARRPRSLVCTCPKRFYQADLVNDVITHCWPGGRPRNPQTAYEVKMAGFGNVDFVVADIDPAGPRVRDFLSVELQAVDITGTYGPAYDALTTRGSLQKAPKYNFNWANVYKRYLTQLVGKGFFHHQWGTKIVAVVQDVLYEYFQSRARFPQLDPKEPTANIVFLVYGFDRVEDGYTLMLQQTVGAAHANIANAVMYKAPPSRDAFCARIIRQISNG